MKKTTKKSIKKIEVEVEVETVKKKETLNVPWIEKYRPSNLDDLVLEEGTKNKLKKIVEDANMPNLIITGFPGIGKTTTILCLARNLYGRHFSNAVLELNASDERGIKAQSSIVDFCKKKLIMQEENGRIYPEHKLVLLDEADNMTKKAQQQINKLMESYGNTTRFAFTCNNSEDIIEAIQSRCIMFRYYRLTGPQITDRLKKICEIEDVPYTIDGLQTLVLTAQGDLRKAINNLQITYNGYHDVVPENVYKLCDQPHPLIINNIFAACYKKDFCKAIALLESLRKQGYSSSDISNSMIDTLKIVEDQEFDDKTRIRFMNEVAMTSIIISRGVNTPLQLTGCIAKMCQ